MDSKIKRHISSAINTFVVTFIVSLASLISTTQGDINSTMVMSFILSSATTGVRAVSKVILENTK